jgi:hypothetical protein
MSKARSIKSKITLLDIADIIRRADKLRQLFEVFPMALRVTHTVKPEIDSEDEVFDAFAEKLGDDHEGLLKRLRALQLERLQQKLAALMERALAATRAKSRSLPTGPGAAAGATEVEKMVAAIRAHGGPMKVAAISAATGIPQTQVNSRCSTNRHIFVRPARGTYDLIQPTDDHDREDP